MYDLSLEQISLIAKKLSHKQRRVIFISGGEPLTRPDIVEVVKIFKQYVPNICINTNAILLSRELLTDLVNAGMNYIQVSLDGMKASHDYIRGEGKFEAAIEKLKLISEYPNVKLHVSCCVSRLNIGDMESLAEYLLGIEKLQIDILGFKRFIPKNEMAGIYNLGKDGLKEMMNRVDSLQHKYRGITQIATDFPQKNILHKQHALDTMKKYGLSCVGCSAATGGPCIRADGTVSPCSLLYVISGNILTQEFDEIYQSEIYQKLCRRDLKGKCASCEQRLICGGCRAAALAISGDYLAEDPECFI